MDTLDSKWWEPLALLKAAHSIRRSMPQSEFFRRSDMKPVRESIASSGLAALRPWNKDWQVHAVPEHEQFPDALLRCGDDVREFELTYVDRPGRRMSEEYAEAEERQTAGLPPMQEGYDPDEESDLALRMIVERIGQKARGYRGGVRPNLLVHVNLDRSKDAPTSLYAWQIGEMFGGSFKSIWLLWGSRGIRLWPNPAMITAT